ncbi:MAG TPA: TIGR03085 family metal-binding protein [Actinopolymorphaceae bacterium]
MAPQLDFAASERRALADLLAELGPDAPTLCDGWTTADLAAHLVIRENTILPAAGIAIPRLAGRTRQAMDELLRTHGYVGTVGRVRTGPSGLTPYRLPALERAANAVEYFVHHEDVRRARPGWQPRNLPSTFEDLLWQRLRTAGRMLFRRVPVGVLLARPTGRTARVRGGEPVAVIEGRPSELMLYAFGRGTVARIEVKGPESAVTALRRSRLGM